MVADCIEHRSALIVVWGDPHRRLFDDVDSERVASDHMPLTPSLFGAVGGGEITWTMVPGPCPGLAREILGEPDVDRLWELINPILRLDAADPARAWREHVARLHERAAIMNGTPSPPCASVGPAPTSPLACSPAPAG